MVVGGGQSDVGREGVGFVQACSLARGIHQGKKSDHDYSLGLGKGMEKFEDPRLCQTL